MGEKEVLVHLIKTADIVEPFFEMNLQEAKKHSKTVECSEDQMDYIKSVIFPLLEKN
jgi:hypothetical protein